MTPEQQQAAIAPCISHDRKVIEQYQQRFAPIILAMVEEFRAKGVNVQDIEHCAPEGLYCGLSMAVQLRAMSNQLNEHDARK